MKMGAAVVDEHVVGEREPSADLVNSPTAHVNCIKEMAIDMEVDSLQAPEETSTSTTPTQNLKQHQIELPQNRNSKEKEKETSPGEIEKLPSPSSISAPSSSSSASSSSTLPSSASAEVIEAKEKPVYEMVGGQYPKASPPPQVIIIPAQQASTVVTNAARKVRRALSMPRNPFRWSRKFKTSHLANDTDAPNRTANINDDNHHHRHHYHHHSTLSSCVGGGRGRTGSILSLNSYEAVAGKDPKVNKTSKNSLNANINENGNANTVSAKAKSSGGAGSDSGSGPISGNGVGVNENSNSIYNENGKRVLRRSSLRKFVNRVAHQLRNSINTTTGANKHASTSPSSVGTAATNGNIFGAATLTDRVPPIGGYQWPADQTPGVMGLKNHGNTCFMNAVLQCLSHTDILAEYFVLDLYKADLKRRNKINSRKFGTKGELTEQLANVLKALWTCKNESDHSTSFKAVVERYGSQFRSSTQHDAQEFLFWLLDKVHEDLNTATKRRYKSVKNNYGRPDEIIAAETLANHIRCNNSFVQAVFQAQFRSSLTCPRCKKQSNTFDPFHCISVQLPQLTQQTIFATVVYLQKQPKQVKYGLRVPAGSPIVALREQLQTDSGVTSDRMVLVDLSEEGFTRVFYDSQPVGTLNGIETIYCIETPPTTKDTNSSTTIGNSSSEDKAKTNENVLLAAESNSKSTSFPTTTHATDLLLLVANVRKKKLKDVGKDGKDGKEKNDDSNCTDTFKDSFERFGAPFSMQVPRDCSYIELQKKLLREMSTILKPEVFSYSTPLKDMFRIRLQDPSADPDTFIEQVEHPLLTEMIDLALSVLSTESGPPHVKLLLEWSEPEQYFTDLNNIIVDHESVARLKDNKNNDTAALSLEQCLEHYTKAETLSAEDAWRCPHCQQYLPVVKTLGLWSLPDILVVHFKRFRQHHGKGPHAAKLTTMVNFPLNAFDMSPHLAKGTNGETPALSSEPYRPIPWRKSKPGDSRSSTLSSRADNKETRYDLYAVCYHQGDTLETGHYTAACKNPYDRQWYKFDDQRVAKVPTDSIQEEIINNEAYMLFYQRRIGDGSECSGSSSNSSDHWVSRIVPAAATATSAAGTLTTSKANSIEKVNESIKEEKIEKLPEKAEAKPVEIPKIPNDFVKEASPSHHSEDLEDKLCPMVVNEENIDFIAPLNVDELSYADDEGEIMIEVKAIPREEILKEPLKKLNIEEMNQINLIEKEKTPIKGNTIVVQAEINTVPSQTVALKVETTPIASIKMNGSNAFSKCEPAISPNSQGTSSQTSSSISSSSSTTSISSRSSPHSLAISTAGASNLQSKFNGFAPTNVNKDIIYSTSLKSNSSGLISAPFVGARSTEFHLNSKNTQQNWHGSRSSVSAVENATHHTNGHTNGLNLRHSFSTSSNYKFRECTDTLSSLLRNSTNTCSKDTLLFIDQQNHSLIEDDDDTFLGSRSLWISPVTPHKLITVSPKN